MTQTLVRFDPIHQANLHFIGTGDGRHALYNFGSRGKIFVQPGYFGMRNRLAVAISLGRPGDQSGYNLTGLLVNDRLLTGAVMCIGPDLVPVRHPQYPGPYPLADLDAATLTAATSLLSAIAQNFYDFVSN
ncbi:hypothetical protein ACFWYW_47040 [Nonomuraea sp. NPDC059023]|uniref:hypothetical protein n=1 Tax=unclassified Nonomuraea TaxID=2593643 RepID=UPI0036CE35FA